MSKKVNETPVTENTATAETNAAVVEVVKKRRAPKNYLNNADLLQEVIKSHAQKRMTDGLAKMLTLLCQRYASKGNFANYTYNDDMQAYAMMMSCRTWKNFNPEKSNNPFAYYTQCVKNCFRQYLMAEKRHRIIRDKLLVAHGMAPSHTFLMDQEGATDGSYQFESIPHNDDFNYNDNDIEC